MTLEEYIDIKILKKDLNYNIGDIILVEKVLYDVIGHVKCNKCQYDILNSCYGKTIFKNRKTNIEPRVCGITRNSDSSLKKSYQTVTITNLRW